MPTVHTAHLGRQAAAAATAGGGGDVLGRAWVGLCGITRHVPWALQVDGQTGCHCPRARLRCCHIL